MYPVKEDSKGIKEKKMRCEDGNIKPKGRHSLNEKYNISALTHRSLSCKPSKNSIRSGRESPNIRGEFKERNICPSKVSNIINSKQISKTPTPVLLGNLDIKIAKHMRQWSNRNELDLSAFSPLNMKSSQEYISNHLIEGPKTMMGGRGPDLNKLEDIKLSNFITQASFILKQQSLNRSSQPTAFKYPCNSNSHIYIYIY